MRVRAKTPVPLLTLLVVSCLLTVDAPSAGALTGGAAAPTSSTPASGTHEALATWFGPGMYGRRTACGQTLTRSLVGVASRTLPCGTLVSVTYDQRSLTIPVLDRGPYAHSAAWDLTSGAAQALGITQTVRIATKIVGRTANSPTLGLPPLGASEAHTGGALAS